MNARSPFARALRAFLRNPVAMAGLVVLALMVSASIAGPALYGVDAFDIVGAPMTPPDAEAWFGTDYLGRDILAAILVGGRATMLVGITAALISVTIGTTIGALAGYLEGAADAALMRITEFFQVLPALLFAMVVVMLFRPSLVTVALSIGVVSWTGTARLVRAEFLRPVGAAMLFEGGLSFLGLGDPNVISWGRMIGQNRAYLLDAWWTVTFPGLALFATVMSVALIGDGVNDALDPRSAA
ncbi:MAG: ABC transporter permease [Alphaproteobacteria bacterium]|nr:ABC transporter permease [Alphaproteobacteria bacterium]